MGTRNGLGGGAGATSPASTSSELAIATGSAKTRLSRLGTHASIGARHILTRIRRLASRAIKSRADQPVRTGPRLSIIMPVYNVERYLEEAVRSVLNQSYRNVQLIIVDDGATDSSGQIADRLAQEDARIRVIHQRNSGLGAARNVGAALATGKYVAFMDSDDVTEPDGYRQCVESLEASGSDFSVSPYRLLRGTRIAPPGRWIQDAHRRQRRGTSLAEFPGIQVNVVAWARVFRRTFFEREVAPFPVGVLFEDQEPASRAYVRARKFDVLTTPLMRWRMRDEGSSITQQTGDIRNLHDRILTTRRAIQILADHGEHAAARERTIQVLTYGTFTLRMIDEGHPDYWAQLSRGIPDLYNLVSRDDIVGRLSLPDRAIYGLLHHGTLEEAVEFIAAGGLNYANWVVSEDADGHLYGKTPATPSITSRLPRWMLRASPRNVSPQVFLERMAWDGDVLEIAGWAYFAGLDCSSAQIRVQLIETTRGYAYEAPAARADLGTPGRSVHRYLDYRDSGFVARVPVHDLLQLTKPGDSALKFVFNIGLQAAGLVSNSRIQHATFPKDTESRVLIPLGRDLTAGARFDPLHGLCVQIHRGGSVTAQRIHLHDRHVTLEWLEEGGFKAVSAQLVHPKKTVTRVLAAASSTSASVEVPVWSGASDLACRITLLDARGRSRNVLMTEATRVISDRGAALAVSRGAQSQPLLFEIDNQAFIEEVGLQGTSVTVRLRIPSRRVTAVAVRLAGKQHIIEATAQPDDQRAVSIDFECRLTQEAGWQDAMIPEGKYALEVDDVTVSGSPRPLRVQGKPEYVDHLPVRVKAGEVLSLTALPASPRSLSLVLATRDTDVMLPCREQSLIEGYRSAGAGPVAGQVYLQCLRGDQVNDSQLAMAKELRLHHPEIAVVWGVLNNSIRVPVGDSRVVIGTEEYFHAIRESAILCFNHELPKYFVKRPGQLVVQTYHGHPFKMMGMSRFEALGYSAIKIRRSLQWRTDWDVLLSPTPLATRLYRENYPLPYEVLEVGHPRNDRLVVAGEEERIRIRRRLGLPDGVKAVLYAPTWRDYATTNPWVSAMVTFVDPGDLARALGPQYVVLLRGHPSHGRGDYVASEDDRVIDVTFEPDINDLIIAADVGVFDYSSIRFDFGVTGKPMVFFVPDEDRFFEAAPALFDFELSAPGAIVKSVTDLVIAIRNSDADRVKYDEAYRAFRDLFCCHDDGHAAERFVDGVLRIYRERYGELPPAEALQRADA